LRIRASEILPLTPALPPAPRAMPSVPALAAAVALLRFAAASLSDTVAEAAARRATESAAATPAETAPQTPWNASVPGIGLDYLVAVPPPWVGEVLRAHNEYRCMHDAPQLSWSLELEAHAKQWVVKGHRQRSPGWELQNVGSWYRIGENAGWGVTDAGGMKSPSGQVIAWYDQIQYTDRRSGKVDNFRYELSQYTQLVWRSTTHVGCAWLHDFFVCHYGPTGNVDGQYSYQVPLARKPYQECRQHW